MNTGSEVGVITFASCNHLMAFFWCALSMVPPSTEFSQTALSTQLRVLLSSTSARFSVFYTDTPLPRSAFTVLSALKIWQFLNLSPLGADITLVWLLTTLCMWREWRGITQRWRCRLTHMQCRAKSIGKDSLHPPLLQSECR